MKLSSVLELRCGRIFEVGEITGDTASPGAEQPPSNREADNGVDAKANEHSVVVVVESVRMKRRY